MKMNKLIEIDELKLELKKSNCKLYNTLLILDKIKDKLKQDKVSKKELLKIIDGDANE